MSGEPRAEWRGRADFAEVAEALGISTDAVVAARTARPGLLIAVYAEHDGSDDPPTFWRPLRRRPDGVLAAVGSPTLVPGFWTRLRADLAKDLGDEGT